jgi:GTP-binding protein
VKFIDEATIEVAAGHGGAGARSFRREKFVPFGGPDGGDGGDGGSVVLRVDPHKSTLLDFQYRKRWEADDGANGQRRNRGGKDGQNLIIPLPLGTQVFDVSSGALVVDLTEPNQEFVLAKGGRGGKGNAFFKTATNQAPEHFQPGENGYAGEYRLSLKLVADVGLLGFPNAGKSTLISRISAARPKIADYPFTTLTPNLGVVRAVGGRSYVVADIPGLLPGAHQGKGLGIKFLKHVERCRILAHLVDPLQIDDQGEPVPVERALEVINTELAAFSEELAGKPQIVVITKTDALTEPGALNEIQARLLKQGLETIAISSVTGAGIDELIELLAKRVVAEKAKAE